MRNTSLMMGWGMVVLTGCGTPVATVGPAAVAPAVQAATRALRFAPASVAELTTVLDRSEHEGQLVKFEASFGKDTWTYTYGTITYGYKLWDHEGHGIRVSNIVNDRRIDGQVTDRDFRPEARGLLVPGTYVQIEGRYSTSRWGSSHGGSFLIEPSIDVYFINGQPTSQFVR